jgi:hypothetical protein
MYCGVYPNGKRGSPIHLNDGRKKMAPCATPVHESQGYRQSRPGRKGTIAGVEVM